MTAKTTAAGVPYDVQGDMSDADRRTAAMRGFVQEFGAVAAAHLESCVRCGMCANACHFYVSTGNPAYTPINKLKPFEQAYHSPRRPLRADLSAARNRAQGDDRGARGVGAAHL